MGFWNLAFQEQLPDPSKSFPGKEDLERSLHKLSKELKETQNERNKAVQELTRLKQHLLEKVSFYFFEALSNYDF